ncbi:glycosyl hydrolase family 18 protein [Pedobacter glucosidilyticus]|uniref:glycosyl hydrolase family 18 protein n=1 Tax=Pedobacter glucosidilyticus TaxID=1122941 RepID=UPI000478939A|nr:glycosyl hydrolase family 18 protein [Pedobacter glucosidilyticus]
MMKKVFYIYFLVLITIQACQKEVAIVPDGYNTGAVREKPTTPYVSDRNFKVVAYYAEGREPDSIELAKFKMITHLHFAFAYPNANGTLKAIARPANFEKMKKLAKENGVKFGVSIAGVSAAEKQIYENIVKDPALRSVFIKNIVDFAVVNDLDGIDIDWEYPTADKGQHITYESFMRELSTELHAWHKYLSAAVTAGVFPGGIRDGITLGAVEAMDFINLMAYDGAGYKGNPNHASLVLTEDVINYWLNQKGIPKEKAVVGIPAYGKNAANAALTFRDLIRLGADPDANSFTNSDGITYYYNGIPTVKQKAQMAKNNANGIMFWEFYQDINGDKSLLKAANDAIGRTY